MSDQPQVTETRIHRGGGGKVAIVDYGKISSEYSVNVSRTYAVPPDWTDNQVAEFELIKIAELRDQIEPILQEEFDERYRQRNWD